MVQVIENCKESILRTLSLVEKLNIIDDQHINQLIKMYEVVDSIVAAMVHELVDEFFRAHIQYNLVGIHLLYFVANGLRQVCFTQTHTAVNDQWVE